MTTAQDVRTRAQALLAPISEAEPGGADAAYDPELDAIKSEVGKLDSPTGGEVDWEMVTRDSQAVLTGRSKDLLIACYAAYGLYETEKLPGLAVGLAVLEGLLEEYWETMFPPVKRKRGRGNALGWLVGRLEIALPLLEPSPADRPALDLVIEGYKKLGAKARDRLEDHAPGMRSVSDALQRLDLKVPKAQAEPEPATPAAEPAGGDAAGGGAAAPAAPEPAAPSPPPAAGQPAPAAAATTAAPSPPTAAPPPDKKDLVATSKEAAKTWLEPLGDPPHGIDARYEADFESIRAEVAKLDSPADDTEVDWEQVGSMADGMLRQTTKDLLLASYFVFARLLSGGLEGLSVGLCVLIGMFEGFEKLWPKRPRGQGNALSWLTDQLERQLSTLSPSAEDRDILEALQKILRELGGLVRDRLEDNSPSMRPLEERVQRMLLALPKPEAAKPPPPPKPAAAPPPRPAAPQATAPRPAVSAPAMPAASADVGSAEEVGKYLQETGRAMVKAANLLRRAQLSSPTAYRLLRSGLWLHLDRAPPAGAGGKTQIPALPAQRRTQFGLMSSNAKWADLLEETESALAQFRFSLDLQRMSAEALQQLGAEYEPARQALLGEVSALLRRMPELPELNAGDGSPLADDQTREWIASDIAAAAGGGGSAGGAGPSDDPGEAFGKIGSMMKSGKGGEAMKAAKAAIDDTGSLRLRFIRRLALAQGCFEGGEPKLARSMFVALDHELSERGLDQWEPRLASQCLEGLLKSSRAAAQKGAATPGVDEALQRLSLIDPVAAARFSS